MANPIRPEDLPAVPALGGSDAFIVDTGTGVYKATPTEIVEAGGADIGLRADLAETTGSALVGVPGGGFLTSSGGAGGVGFIQSGTGAVARTAQDKLRDIISVLDYGADSAGVADSRAAFSAAATAAGTGGCIVVPRGTYKIEDVVDILDGQTWRFEGATLTHTDDTKTILRADSKSDWTIEGNVTLVGLLTSAATAAETGLRITSCKRYRVEGVTAKLFKGKGIWLDGVDSGTYRGDRGQFTDCATHESTVGLQIDAGAGSEYNTWVNFCASGNVNAIIMGAGNNTMIGGNFVDNTTGVKLVNGSNHGHGMFVGANINHNQAANIEAVGVITGYSFVGCHIYGNGGLSGPIWLNGCKGITITSGILDCPIYNDSGTGSGANYILDNYLPLDYGVPLISNNGALGQLYVSGNYGATGPWESNDASPVYVEATRASSTQGVSAGATTLIFNNEIKDARGAYDPATGVFTAPVAGTYEVTVAVSIGAASGLVTSYLTWFLNNVSDLGYVPVIALTGTLGIGSGVLRVSIAAGDTLRVKSTITGTTPVLNITQSRLTIALVA